MNKNISYQSTTYRMAWLCCALWLSLCGTNIAVAGVNVKNGNFYTDYTDIVLDKSVVIQRTYNSRAMSKGWFGKGWGSDFEVYLEISGDGTVVIHENGTGRRTKFFPPKVDIGQIQSIVSKIMDAAAHEGRFQGKKEREFWQDKLRADADVRRAWWRQYIHDTSFTNQIIPVGTVMTSRDMMGHRLERTADGFTRTSGGVTDYFNIQGHLVRQVDGSNNLDTRLTWDDDGKLTGLTYQGKKLAISMNPDGTIAQIEGPNGETAYYRYRDGLLVWSRDMDNNEYYHRYDDSYNMIGIAYQDDRQKIMTYTSTSKIRSVTSRSGSTTWYGYGHLYQNDHKRGYYTEEKDTRYDPPHITRYEYHIVYEPDGRSYTNRTVATQSGMSTEKKYNKDNELVELKRGSRKAGFKYDKKGHLIEKINDHIITRMRYTNRDKIAEVTRQHEGESEPIFWIRYTYDKKNNLITAKDNIDRSIRLEYDKENLVSVVRSKDTTLRMTYNKQRKPIRVVLDGIGKLLISYDAYDEITDVKHVGLNSKKQNDNLSSEISLKITQVIQRLISMVKPAGVSFGL